VRWCGEAMVALSQPQAARRRWAKAERAKEEGAGSSRGGGG
jgi:hypothetical protein